MNDQGMKRHDGLLTALLLFVGFSGLLGWLGTTGFMISESGGIRTANVAGMLTIMGFWALCASFFLVFAAVGLWWGWRRLKRHERKTRFLFGSLASAVLVSPATVIVGLAAILMAPYVYGLVFHNAGVLTQSVDSPDGRFTAYVRDMPSIDGPNHHYFVRQAGRKDAHWVGRLMEDVDAFQRLHWSPRGDMVVFQSRYALVAVRLADWNCAVVPLDPSAAMVWRNGTFSVTGPPGGVVAVEFPRPGVLSVRFQRESESRTVGPEAFKPRDPGFLVNEFRQVHLPKR
jgi:hypothetical protein